jgi:hypothetical protein
MVGTVGVIVFAFVLWIALGILTRAWCRSRT